MKKMSVKDKRNKTTVDWEKVLICGVTLGILASILALLLILTAKLS